MKLKKIDFNAELIGQDGIVVKTSEGKEVKQLTYFKCCSPFPLGGVVDVDFTTWTKDGKFDPVATLSDDLIMYKEVEVMTVDEFYDECFSDVNELFMTFRQFAHKLAAAVKAGEVEV
jgi:hypothetical protein